MKRMLAVIHKVSAVGWKRENACKSMDLSTSGSPATTV
jgi:hypothetical protein